jgi:hypothetical protein
VADDFTFLKGLPHITLVIGVQNAIAKAFHSGCLENTNLHGVVIICSLPNVTEKLSFDRRD